MSEKSKNILLGVLIVGLVSMTVAYAALSTNLAINGTANVAATRWDIHFANVQVDTSTGKTNIPQTDYSLGTLDASTSSTTGTLIEGLTATLKKPGDKLVVKFDIVNTGTITAKNTGFTSSLSPSNDVVTYTLTCGSGANGSDSQLAANTGSASCELTLLYNDTADDITQTSQTAGEDQVINNPEKNFTFGASWTYVQQ